MFGSFSFFRKVLPVDNTQFPIQVKLKLVNCKIASHSGDSINIKPWFHRFTCDNQISARTLIGHSAMIYSATKLMAKSLDF